MSSKSSMIFFVGHIVLFTLLLLLLLLTGRGNDKVALWLLVVLAVIELIDFALSPACGQS